MVERGEEELVRRVKKVKRKRSTAVRASTIR
jgi:hypothetical protein